MSGIATSIVRGRNAPPNPGQANSELWKLPPPGEILLTTPSTDCSGARCPPRVGERARPATGSVRCPFPRHPLPTARVDSYTSCFPTARVTQARASFTPVRPETTPYLQQLLVRRSAWPHL